MYVLVGVSCVARFFSFLAFYAYKVQSSIKGKM